MRCIVKVVEPILKASDAVRKLSVRRTSNSKLCYFSKELKDEDSCLCSVCADEPGGVQECSRMTDLGTAATDDHIQQQSVYVSHYTIW
jgi:hypothetical protein